VTAPGSVSAPGSGSMPVQVPRALVRGVLVVGTATSALCLAAGLLLELLGGTVAAEHSSSHPLASGLASPGALLQLGLLLLLATPSARVLVLAFVYLRQRCYLLAVTSILVLVALGVSVLLAWSA